jgi:RNA polymerase sigma-70 factor (ECF subfamily)
METRTPDDDKELFSRIANGDKAAFAQIFKKYVPQLIPFISGITKSETISDEIIQDVFMRLWFNREKLSVVTDARSWIFRIAAGVCYNFLQQTIVDNRVINKIRHESHYKNGEIVETVKSYTLVNDIRHGVQQLTPEQKTVYRLSKENGLTVPDIADQLSVSPNYVRSLLNSSQEDILDYLQGKGHTLSILLASSLYLFT